ncbi:MAG: sulfatase [Pirellulaceae bacterium]|nr:sulfatase [Pirellulaceae bacterium]
MTRQFLPLPILLFLFVGVVSADDRPNFIIFVADDMAWDDCGAYGHPSIRTPNIDALAKAGMRFDRAYLTCSSCSPSRCSILTGRYPHATGAGELHLPLPAKQTMLTQPLKQSGYWTAAVGKWHLGEAVAHQVDYRKGSPPPKMGDAWVAALKERPTGKPFFLWAAHTDPHRGYKPGAVDPPHQSTDVIVPPSLPDTPRVREDLALYYDEISRFDEHIGMTLAELDRQAIADNTFVLVISDNGRPFPYAKTMVHVPGVRTPFVVRWPAKVTAGSDCDSVVSTVDIAPTILELAGLEPLASFQGKSLSKILSNPKLTTRRYAFAEHNWHDYRAFERGVHSQSYCYVRNWLPDTPGTPPADAVTSVTFADMKQLREQGKLAAIQEATSFATPRPTEFLYDVSSDPDCLRNLANDKQHHAILDEMRSALADWQAQTDDQFPGADRLTPDGFDRSTGKRLITAAHPSLQR